MNVKNIARRIILKSPIKNIFRNDIYCEKYNEIYIDKKIKKMRILMEGGIHLPISKYPSSWISGYISRINNLMQAVRESKSVDLVDSLYLCVKKIFGNNPDIDVAKKIIKYLEDHPSINESSYLMKANKYFNISVIFICLLIGATCAVISFVCKDDPNFFLDWALPIFCSALSGVLGSFVGWAGRSPISYDVGLGGRKIDIQNSLLSAFRYPLIPAIVCSMVTIAMISGALPFEKSVTKNIAYIILVGFAIGYSEAVRKIFLDKISNMAKK